MTVIDKREGISKLQLQYNSPWRGTQMFVSIVLAIVLSIAKVN